MADLYLSDGGTVSDDETQRDTARAEVPASRPASGSRPWDRHAAVPATAADRGTFWAPAEDVQYPTRMARRRALEAAQILDGWRPDPVLTPPLLERVGEELLRLFDAPRESPDDVDHVLAEREEAVGDSTGAGTSSVGAAAAAADVPAPVARRRGRGRSGSATAGPRRGWLRRGRAVEPPAASSVVDAGVGSSVGSGLVRQDDPVDDAAWFAGLREMAREEERLVPDSAEPLSSAADDDVWASSLSVPETTDLPQAEDDTPTPADAPVVEAPPTVEAPRSAGAPRTGNPPPPAGTPSTVLARPSADVQPIVPATTPRFTRAARRGVAAALALLVVLVGVAVVVTRGGDEPSGARGPVTAPQQAVVVAFALSQRAAAAAQVPAPKTKKGAKAQPAPVQPRAGDVTGLSLIAAGGGTAQQVLVPSRLLLDVPGAGRVPLSRSLAGSSDGPGEAVADALEVKVDATWTLDSDALAALVDRVGGVVVDVDADVTKGTQVGAAVLLGAGPHQKLAGEQAALFAQFLGADEPEATRLARQEQVLRAVLTALPDDPATIRAILAELPGAPDGAALRSIAAVVSAARLAAVSDELASTVLPVTEIDAGGDVSAYGLDDEAAQSLVASRLPGARLPVAAVGHVRVLVQNGVGTPGLGDTARSQLLAAGLRYLAGGNLPGFGQDQSVVLLRDASPTNRERGTAVAKALGLDQSSLRISESAPTIADVVVILGKDYRAP